MLWIIILGLFGILARYSIDQLLATNFPWSTLLINILGAFLAGWVAASTRLDSDLRMGLLVGFCGGFTTFSAYCLRGWQMIASGHSLQGISYLTFSPILGIFAVILGLKLASL
jgi:CrcB protein